MACPPLRPLRDAKLGRTALSRFYDDLHIVPQRGQETHEALNRISPELIWRSLRMWLGRNHRAQMRLGSEVKVRGWGALRRVIRAVRLGGFQHVHFDA